MLERSSRILITGCGGMLGEAVYATFQGKCTVLATDLVCHEPWLSPLDVRDLTAMRTVADTFKPTWIFHLAALTDVEYCETHPEEAYATNALGAENAAIVCQERNIPLVYISTAGVFDGAQDTYVDYDEPNPLSIYGKSKFAGERVVQALVSKHLIFRAGWMMGGGPKKDKKFVNKLVKQIRGGAKELNVVDDKLGSPTYTFDFAKTLAAVIDTGAFGLYHMVGQGECSRYEVAEEILRHLGLEKTIKLTKVNSDFWAKEYFAPRPKSEKLINLKLQLRGIHSMRNWKESLSDYLASHDW